MTISRTICLGFLAVITIGTLLLILPFSSGQGSWNAPIVALFTSTSAVCVTGLSVVDLGTYFSFWGQLIIACLIQIGGLGYMTTTTFLILILGRRFNFRQKLAIQEAFDRPFLQGTSSNVIINIISMTLIFELSGAFLLLTLFARQYNFAEALWLSIFHSVSAWNNAGFSLFKVGLLDYYNSWTINLVIPGLIIMGGIGYQVIMEIYYWINSKLRRSPEKILFSLNFKVAISTTLFLLIIGTFLIFVIEFNNPDTLSPMNLKDKILAAWFQAVVPRTAGFNTIDYGKMTIMSLFVTMALMFIGASPNGTGGGIKTTTFRILTSCTRSALRGNDEVILYQREIPKSLILKAVGVVFGSAILVICVTFLICFIEFSLQPTIFDENFSFERVLFEVISAFATVGLSTGITASFSAWSQLLLVLTMYSGRVSVIVLIVALVGETKPSVIEYPEENLLVG